jgi:hypothetical protein
MARGAQIHVVLRSSLFMVCFVVVGLEAETCLQLDDAAGESAQALSEGSVG